MCSSAAYWPLTFVLGQLRNLGYFIKSVCGTAWISQSQTTELSSIKLRAQFRISMYFMLVLLNWMQFLKRSYTQFRKRFMYIAVFTHHIIYNFHLFTNHSVKTFVFAPRNNTRSSVICSLLLLLASITII